MAKLISTMVAMTASLSLMNCGKSSSVQPDAAVVPDDAPAEPKVDAMPDGSVSDLPAPAIDTVEMKLNGLRYTLVDRQSCRDGNAGIVFDLDASGDNPTLFLEQIDLSSSGSILISATSPWHLDLDDGPPDNDILWDAVAPGCAATIVENTAATFELSTEDCAIKNELGSETGMVSFRVRCARQD